MPSSAYARGFGATSPGVGARLGLLGRLRGAKHGRVLVGARDVNHPLEVWFLAAAFGWVRAAADARAHPNVEPPGDGAVPDAGNVATDRLLLRRWWRRRPAGMGERPHWLPASGDGS
jgi:hypothetical protein